MCFWLMWMKDTKSQNTLASLLQRLLPSHTYPLQTDSETINSTSVFYCHFNHIHEKTFHRGSSGVTHLKHAFFGHSWYIIRTSFSGLIDSSSGNRTVSMATLCYAWQRCVILSSGLLSRNNVGSFVEVGCSPVCLMSGHLQAGLVEQVAG